MIFNLLSFEWELFKLFCPKENDFTCDILFWFLNKDCICSFPISINFGLFLEVLKIK